MSLPHGMPSGIYLTGFWILRQDFWARIHLQRASPSFNPHTEITILLTQQFNIMCRGACNYLMVFMFEKGKEGK